MELNAAIVNLVTFSCVISAHGHSTVHVSKEKCTLGKVKISYYMCRITTLPNVLYVDKTFPTLFKTFLIFTAV